MCHDHRVPAPAAATVGRDDVVAEVEQARRHSGRIVLEGPPGIGKTTALRLILDRARDDGLLVLAASPTEVESNLPYGALADVLRPLHRHLPELPAPQQAALAAALLITDGPADADVDERAVAAGTLALLARAARRPCLVAVDDAMWLDESSARALTFALRRVEVPVVACVRTGAGIPLGLDRDAVVLPVEPLSPDQISTMLAARLEDRLAVDVVARVADESGGNPLLAWEIARAVLRSPRAPLPGEDLPLAEHSVTGMSRAALDGLPARTISALRLASLLSAPRTADLLALGTSLADLDPATEAGLVEVLDGRISFLHPVYATAARTGLSAADRRELHLRLAGSVADPDERARQLARAHVDPDESVADEVAAAAHRLRAKGAPGAAAELLLRASDLTPLGDERRAARALEAARCRFDSGDFRAAAAIVRSVLESATGELAAAALLLLADLCWYDGSIDPASPYDVASQALALAIDGSHTAGEIHSHLAIFAPRPADSARHAAQAVAVYEAEPGLERELASALFAQFLGEARAGYPPRTELLETALALEGDTPIWASGTVPAIWWVTIDDHDQARRRLERLLRHAVARGDESTTLEVLTHLVGAELLAGRLDAAAENLARLDDLDVPHEWESVLLRAELAWHRGVVETARPLIDALSRTVESWYSRGARLLAARLAMADGRPDLAVERFQAVSRELEDLGIVEWQWQRHGPDWVEAALAAGDRAEAERVTARLRARHERLPRPWTRLAVARCAVLLGEDGALEEAVAALAETPPDAVLVDRGRTALAAGLLDEAAANFRRAGASGWLDRVASTRAERRRTAGPDADEVRRVLKGFHRPAVLGDSTLGSSVEDVRTRVLAALEAEFADNESDRLLRQVLEAAYLAPDAGHAAAMRSLHLSRTTYYRRLAEATDRLAGRVLAGSGTGVRD